LESKLSQLKEREQRLKAVVLPKQSVENLNENSEKEQPVLTGLEKLEYKLADLQR
jgi:hypothetical protein